MFKIKFLDRVMALVNFAIASFGFSYHFTEDWVISLIISVNILFATTILKILKNLSAIRSETEKQRGG